MKTFYRFVWFSILMLSLMALAMIFSGCGSKKKTVKKTEYSTDIAIVKKVKETTDKTEESRKETDTKKEVAKESESEDFQAEIDDPTKEFELEKEIKDGKTTWRGKNIKNLNNKNSAAKEETKEASKTSEQNGSRSSQETKKDTSVSDRAREKASETVLEVERGFPWWILVICVSGVYLGTSLFKGFNPLLWLK